jgi:hypothetical protein
MRKLIALTLLLVVFCAPAAAAEPETLCGIGHTDVTTGQFVCDDPPHGIGHTDDGGPGVAALLEGALLLLDIANLY